ncbi:MAG: chemotaxis protein CheW [Pirellulales bacterium]
MKKTNETVHNAMLKVKEEKNISNDHPIDCWRVIGVGGDRSCPELKTYIHCRNCPVMTDAAEAFFNRTPPEGYLDEWQQVLEATPESTETSGRSVLIFRLADEWFSLDAESLTEVTPLRKIHTIPHRTNSVFAGMVNVRGQLLLCCSLHGLLGLRQMDPKVLKCNKTSDQQNPGSQSIQLTDDDAILAPERLLVTSLTTGRTTRRWTFPVNEVAGVHRISNEELRKVPSTVGKPGQRFSSALFSWNSRTVSLLDTKQIFEGIPEQIPS